MDDVKSVEDKSALTVKSSADKLADELLKHPFFMKEIDEKAEDLPPLIEAMRQIKWDEDDSCEEKALKHKEEGNRYYRSKKYRNARVCYCVALDFLKEESNFDDLKATLFHNRGSTQIILGNYRSAICDMSHCVQLKPDYSKAIAKAARCCLKLEKFDECDKWCQMFEDNCSADEDVCRDIVHIRKECLQLKREASRKLRKQEVEQRSLNDRLVEAIKKRGLYIEDLKHFPHGKCILKDEVLKWTVYFEYPNEKVVENVNEFDERCTLRRQFEEMLDGDERPKWNLEGLYRSTSIVVFFKNELTGVPKENRSPIDLDKSLCEVLRDQKFRLHSTLTLAVIFGVPTADYDCTGPNGLCTNEDKERLAYQAIKQIHFDIDDDKDGLVVLSESLDFTAVELEKPSASFSKNMTPAKNRGFTSDDLWDAWKNSTAHKWTVEDVAKWISEDRVLSRYQSSIKNNLIDGPCVPRLAADEKDYLNSIVGITDSSHRKRLKIKALEIVLFGPEEKPRFTRAEKSIFGLTTVLAVVLSLVLMKNRRTRLSFEVMAEELNSIEEMKRDLLNSSIRNARRSSAYDIDPKLLGKSIVPSLVNDLKEKAAECVEKRQHATTPQEAILLYEQELKILRNALKSWEQTIGQTRSKDISEKLIELLQNTFENEEKLLQFKRDVIDREIEDSNQYV
ncbi:hypothetical protein ACOME3_006811 [Neoechinorhynchus agilis]